MLSIGAFIISFIRDTAPQIDRLHTQNACIQDYCIPEYEDAFQQLIPVKTLRGALSIIHNGM